MADEICIIKNGDENFSRHLNFLVEKCDINPIYSTNFEQYYNEIKDQEFINNSIIFIQKDSPIAAFVFTNYQDLNKNGIKITYYGMPAPFIRIPNLENGILEKCVKILLQYLNDNNIKVKNGKILDSFLISITPDLLKSNRFEKFVFTNSRVTPRFNRVIDLGLGIDSITSKYSKTVIKSVSENNLEFQIIDKHSSKELIEEEVKKLGKLHIESAGRQTRSEKSWQLQSEMIARGNGFLVSGYRNGLIKTSAFFMTNSNSAFYGVSASISNRSGESFSHKLIDCGIDYLCKNEFSKLWLGEQHSYISDEVTLKERNIELFKSFFGGELILDLILDTAK